MLSTSPSQILKSQASYSTGNRAKGFDSWQLPGSLITSRIRSRRVASAMRKTHGAEFGSEIVAQLGLEDTPVMVAIEERRKRKRIALHWPVRLFRDLTTPSVESTTENLTSNGFYCISKEPFQMGERLECIIAIPAGSFGYNESPIRLQCRVRIARVEDERDGFGLGCYIEDYDLLTNSRTARSGMNAPDSLV